LANVLQPILQRLFESPRRVVAIDDQKSWKAIELLGGAAHLAEKIEATCATRHVGVMLPTGGAFIMASLTAWLLDRTVVPINYLLSPNERQFVIDHCETDTIITAGPLIDHLGERPRGVKLLHLDRLVFNGPPPLRWPPRPKGHQIAALLYTSGTSGRPKGVMLSHDNLFHNAMNSIAHMSITNTETFLGVLPQFHSFGLTALTIVPLIAGCPIVYSARFVPRRIVKLIRRHRPGIFMAIPSMYGTLLSVKEAEPDDFRSIRLAISGSEPLSASVRERFNERFDVLIREGYGLTETSPIVSVNSDGAYRPGSVGQLIADCQVVIADDEGRHLPTGEEGEVLIRGHNIMAGYYKQPDLTREAIDDDGYFHTGDWGKRDHAGYLYITGRKKEMLIIGGENVFPREIEEVLNRHESVKDSAVVGRRDDVRGEVPIAFVEVKEDAEFDAGALRSFCREHLAQFKVPREIRQIDALPRNPTGKVLRRELAEKVTDEQNEE